MACSSSKQDKATSDRDFITTKDIGKLISECIAGLIKTTKLKPNKNVAPIIECLGKYTADLVSTIEGRRLLCRMKHLASRVKDKDNFLAILWRMFHIARRISTEGSGRLGLLFMGTALLVFLLSMVTGLGEGVLAIWFTLAARTFALQLFAGGSGLVRKSVKETMPSKKIFVNLLNTVLCGGGQEHEQVSREEIRQLEVRFTTATVCPDHGWVLL